MVGMKPGFFAGGILTLLSVRQALADYPHENLIQVYTDGGAEQVMLYTLAGLLVCLILVSGLFFLYRLSHKRQSVEFNHHLPNQMIEMATDGIFAADREGICLLCNPAMVEMLGYTHANELVGRHLHSLIHYARKDGSDYHARDCKVYHAMINGSSIQVDDEVFWRADGTSFPVEYRSVPLRDKGKVIGSVVSFRDLSKDRATAGAKEGQEDFTTVILERSPMAIAITRLDGQYLYKNPKFIEWQGPVLDNEGSGQATRFYVNSDDHQRLARIVEEKGFVKDAEVQMRCIDGTTIWASVTWEYIDYKGETAKIIFMDDITLQKEAERNLLNAIENIPEGFAVYNDENRLIISNKKFQELYGFVKGDVGAHPTFLELLEKDVALGYVEEEIIGGEDYATRRAAYRNYCVGEFDLKLTDGRSITVRERRSSDGSVFCIHTDVTRLKQAEERLKNAIENITDAFVLYDSKGELLMCNSHFRQFYGYSDFETRPGVHFRDLGLLDIKRNTIIIPNGESKESYFERKQEYRRTLQGEFIVHLKDGRILLTRDRQTAEGGIVSIQTDITERYKAEQELKTAERRFSDIANATSDWFWETGVGLRLTISSPHFHQMLGVEEKDILGRSWRDLYDVNLPGNAPDKILTLLESLEKHKPFKEFQCAIKAKDGEIHYLSVSGTPILDDQGTFYGYRGAARDRTSLAKAEQSLEQSRNMFLSILEASPFAIVITSIDGDAILYVNPKTVMMSGLNENDLLDKPIDTIIPDRDERKKVVRQVLAEGRVESYQMHMQNKAGDRHWIEGMSALMHFNGEQVLLSMFHDISARKEAEHILKDKLAFENTLFQTIPSPIFYKDKDGLYQGGNKAFSDYIGIDLEDLKGKSVYDVAPEEKAKVYEKADNDLLANPELQIYEAPVRYADGTDRIVKFYKAVYLDGDGKPAGIIGNMADITENKRLENELRKNEDRFRDVLLSAPVPILISRPDDGSIAFINEGASRLFGMDKKGPSNYRAKNFYVDPLRREEFVSELKRNGEVKQFEVEFQSLTGRRFWALMSATMIPFENEPGVLVSFVDISSRKEMEESLLAMTIYDPHTGAANRRFFFNKAEEEMKRAKRYKHPLSILIIDADNFKEINRIHGHDIGDKTLRILSDICLAYLRETDTFGRIAGEEFAFLLPETDKEGAIAFGERIRDAIASEEIRGRKGPIDLAVSIGIACHYGPDGEVEELVNRAEEALVELQEEGGNRLLFKD